MGNQAWDDLPLPRALNLFLSSRGRNLVTLRLVHGRMIRVKWLRWLKVLIKSWEVRRVGWAKMAMKKVRTRRMVVFVLICECVRRFTQGVGCVDESTERGRVGWEFGLKGASLVEHEKRIHWCG
jgi:hypothetical protein